MTVVLFLLYVVLTVFFVYRGFPAYLWEVASLIYLIIAVGIITMPWPLAFILVSAILAVILVIRIPRLRHAIADFFYRRALRSIPSLSPTEEEALSVGDTWVEASLFRGAPDWSLAAKEMAKTKLSKAEQDFLDNETQILCAMLDEWQIQQDLDLPKQVWTFIRDKGFLGLVISKDYGGKGFSARAHSDIILKIASRSVVAAVTVMVPNSLGPGELLHYYGTQKQKDYYLPRLAAGTEIPCFALTEPEAGSDATSIQSTAIVCKRKIAGREVLGLSVSLNKRWITLAPVATLIGLAVHLHDPEGLLQGTGKEGITCLLMGRDTKGLEIGNRHLAGSQPFMNGSIRGHDIFVPIDAIIGGQERAGSGWQMLVECLAIGRSISLPALGAALGAIGYMTSSAYARIRRQFGVEIGQFEGVQEKLAEIAGLTYIINATRLMTAAAVDAHKKPACASVITKYWNTELARVVINNAMDICGGRAVVVGPRNFLVNYYQSLPVAITVEGANIMSRNLLIFGQGSMACHPYIRRELYALQKQDKAGFRRIIWKHIYYFMQNCAKTIGSAWTGGYLIHVGKTSSFHRAYQRVTQLSYAYAWIADFALIYLGGSLKRRERLSAKLADALSYLYLSTAVLSYFEANGSQNEEAAHLQWALAYCLHHGEAALLSFCANFPSRALGFLLRILAFPLGRRQAYPSDDLDNKLATVMMDNNSFRSRLKDAIYMSFDPSQPLDRLEYAYSLMLQHQQLRNKVADLKRLKGRQLEAALQEKVQNKELTSTEMDLVLQIEAARWDAILVDEFGFDPMKKGRFRASEDAQKNPL